MLTFNIRDKAFSGNLGGGGGHGTSNSYCMWRKESVSYNCMKKISHGGVNMYIVDYNVKQ